MTGGWPIHRVAMGGGTMIGRERRAYLRKAAKSNGTLGDSEAPVVFDYRDPTLCFRKGWATH